MSETIQETTDQNRPRYKHNCPHCLFLGNRQLGDDGKVFDLYFCAPPNQITVLTRHADGSEDFHSGLWNVQEEVKKFQSENNVSFIKALDSLIEFHEAGKNIGLTSMLIATKIAFLSNYMTEDFKSAIGETETVNSNGASFNSYLALGSTYEAYIVNEQNNKGILIHQYAHNECVDFDFLSEEQLLGMVKPFADKYGTEVSVENIDTLVFYVTQKMTSENLMRRFLLNSFSYAVSNGLYQLNNQEV